MSNLDEFRKKNSDKYEFNKEAAQKNKLLKEKYSGKSDRFYKRLWRWFTSLDDKLIRELITNWLLIVLPIIIFVVVSVSQDMLDKNQFTSLNELGGYSLVVMVSVITFIVAVIYKFILKIRKKKGIYWPENKKRK